MIKTIETSKAYEYCSYPSDGVFKVAGDSLNIYIAVNNCVYFIPAESEKFFNAEPTKSTEATDGYVTESFALKMLAVSQGNVKEIEL
jgi:hypothetical protein